MPYGLAICGINAEHLSIMRKNRDDSKEHLKKIEKHSHPDIKSPTLRGATFEEFDLAFTAAVRRQNSLIGIPLDCILGPDAVGNYNGAWNFREEKIKFCARLRGQAFNDNAETV